MCHRCETGFERRGLHFFEIVIFEIYHQLYTKGKGRDENCTAYEVIPWCVKFPMHTGS